MSGKELPKVIDKSEADIDAAIAAITSCDLPAGLKAQKIKLSNLRN